jgi:BlaI family penicillinase repressor
MIRMIKMNNANKITDAEWKVMEIVWENGQLKASKIIEELSSKTSWNDKTIRTLIRRLVEKNILGVKKVRVNEFYALASKEECVKEVTQTFIKKIYKGSVGLLISNFVKEDKLTNEDINMLKQILKNREEDDKNKKL